METIVAIDVPRGGGWMGIEKLMSAPEIGCSRGGLYKYGEQKGLHEDIDIHLSLEQTNLLHEKSPLQKTIRA